MRPDNPDNIATLALILGFLPIAAAFMVFDAVQVAANQLLRGLKDVKAPMIITGISFWGLGFQRAISWRSTRPCAKMGSGTD
jgi:MATE family multidrug resistance protein